MMFMMKFCRSSFLVGNKTELMNQIERDITECRRIYEEVMKKEGMKKFFDRAEQVYDSGRDFNPEIITLI